ncbi:MAG: hypothetical protein E6G42_06100 [Actinobacteria bacterium]|nr:MAG: hypothetical protein E6G42_06100 [Actinomycetota bacterium]
MVWELIFMLVILKIPIVYLCLVVWWAVKSEPRPLEGAALPASLPEDPSGRGWRFSPDRPRRRGPHGGPARSYQRTARAGLAPVESPR